MPTKPWSVPQMNRFSRCVRAVVALLRRAVDRAVVVAGEAADRRRREHVGVDRRGCGSRARTARPRRPCGRTSGALPAGSARRPAPPSGRKLASAVIRITPSASGCRRRAKLFGEQITPLRTSPSSLRLLASGTARESLKNTIVSVVAQVAAAGVSSTEIDLDERQLARLRRDRPRLTSLAQPHAFRASRPRRARCRASSSSPSSSTTPTARPSLDRDPLDAGAQPQFAAQLAELAHQVLEDQPHAGQRPGQALPGRSQRNMMQNWPKSMSCSRALP